MGGPLTLSEPDRRTLRALFEGHGVTLAYLYGSQARGDAGPLADVDVAVLFDAALPPEERFRRVLLLAGELGMLFRRDDVHVVDLAEAPPLLRHRVYHDGRLLYGTDEAARVRFATAALRDYVDTEPLRRIKRHYLLRRLRRPPATATSAPPGPPPQGVLTAPPKEPPMVDVQTVVERLTALEGYIAELDHHARYPFGDLTADFVKYRAAQHSLLLAAQAVLDIAAHIVSADYDLRVQSYRQAIEELGRVGVLPPDLAARLAPLAGFRNLLVHDYLTVDPARVYEVLMEGRDDLRQFARRVADYLERASPSDGL